MSKSDPTAIDIQWDPLSQRMSGVAYHGDTPFDVPFMSHIEGNLWTGGCTKSLILPKNIEHLISLYPWEQYRIKHEMKSMNFNWLYDGGEVPAARIHAIADWAVSCLEEAPTLIHCQAGLNRSSLVAALALMKNGRSAEDAITLLRTKRSPAILCNQTFERWLRGET